MNEWGILLKKISTHTQTHTHTHQHTYLGIGYFWMCILVTGLSLREGKSWKPKPGKET